MSPRSIRRAAERKANKLARKVARQLDNQQLEDSQLSEELDFTPERAHPISHAQLLANRANAQLSTGPTTPGGKAISSLNAVKTALTGRTVLLTTDDAAAYEQHLRDYDKELKPMTPRERELVQSLADTAWRLDRIPGLEMAIYGKGRIHFAEQFDDHEPALRLGLIELETFLTYEKQLRNLQLQEARLHRRREKDAAELRQLQQERNRREREELEITGKHLGEPLNSGSDEVPNLSGPKTSKQIGFEFSTGNSEASVEGVCAANLLNAGLKQDDRRIRQHANAA